jgi:UDP-N-acetylmuramate dehydrogenase
METFQNHPLAPYTTVKIGGPADTLILTHTTEEFVEVLKSTPQDQITILGGGSNMLISDKGVRGVVIKNLASNVKILNTDLPATNQAQSTVFLHQDNPSQYLDFTKLNYDESYFPQTQVQVDSGMPFPQFLSWTLENNLTGLQWFGYIPGTVGGAIFCNIHGGSYNLNQYLNTITVFNLQTSKIEDINSSDLTWSYDYSTFQQQRHLIILSAVFQLYQGDVDKAKDVRKAWIIQKTKVQPPNSLGSVFKNPPSDSAGRIIDQELGLKGYCIGDAQISPKHANFIVNLGKATATDYFALVRHVQSLAKSKLNINLEPEIKFLGNFD